MLRLFLAGFSGLMLFASFQPTGLWWAAPLGFAVFFSAVTPRNAILAAWVQGLVLYLLLLPWVGEFVGWYAWIALAVVQSLYSLAFGLGLRWLFRSPEHSSSVSSMVVAGVATSAWFVATEFVRSSWPFGGFPWGRIAWGQVGGPLAWWIRLGGPALVTFVTVLSGFALTWLFWSVVAGRVPFFRRQLAPLSRPTLLLPSAITLIVTVAVGVVLSQTAHINPWDDNDGKTPTVSVAAIQGNVPRLGLDFAEQRRAVLDNHARQTQKLADAVARGEQPQPDIVIWPENASDVNPYRSEDARQVIEDAVATIHAPILLGTVTPEHNEMVVWTDQGPMDIHDKRFLQPFGEYMPMRDLIRKITPLVDRAGNFQPGTGNGVVRMPVQDSQAGISFDLPVGVATCYEISFDGALRDAVRGGAQLLTTPTNNATFGFTDMTYQQLAMSRMRAMEYDRALVVAATSGVSAIVEPNGSVAKQTHIFEADTLTAELPLKENLTLSAKIGPWAEWVLAAAGLIAVIIAIFTGRAGLASNTKNNMRTTRNKNGAKKAKQGVRNSKTKRK